MKSMKKKLMDNMKQGVAKIAGNVAMKTGESAIDSYCFFFDYEPEIPQELLKNKLDK